MKKNRTDFFEQTSSTQKTTEQEWESSNFFLQEDRDFLFPQNTTTSEPIRRLNDYDFNLLREDAYKDVSDDLFKLEYKISKTEKEIKSLKDQIQAAIDIGDDNLIKELSNLLQNLNEDYEALLAIYNNKSISAKLSDKIWGMICKRFKSENLSVFQKNLKQYTDLIISKLPKQISSIIELKKSLNKLENINKSVDELVNLNIPYGENINKYEQLSRYIIKANSIQSEISRYIKK